MRINGLNSTISRRTAGSGIALLVAILCVAAISFASVSHAFSTSIYLYEGGQPVNITSQAYYQDPHVFYKSGPLIGTVDSNDNIENASGTVIGYIVID